MDMVMNSTQRLKEVTDYKPINCAAVSGWLRMPPIDHNIEDSVRGTIAYTDYCGWDLIKIMRMAISCQRHSARIGYHPRLRWLWKNSADPIDAYQK